MKTILALLTLLMGTSGNFLLAQGVEGDSLNSATPWKQRRKARSFFTWEVGYNTFTNGGGRYATSVQEGGSIKLNLQSQHRWYAGPFFMGLGLGGGINEFRFREHILLTRQGDHMVTTVDTVSSHLYGKDKFQLIYLGLPLEVGVFSRSVRFALGIKPAVQLYAKTKRKYDEAAVATRKVQGGNEHFLTNLFQYALTARLEYQGLGIYGNYYPSSLFRKDAGPALHMAQVGISYTFAARIGYYIRRAAVGINQPVARRGAGGAQHSL